MTDKDDPYTFCIDDEVADQVVASWLMRHISFVEATIMGGSQATEEWIEADKDLKAMRHVLRYVGGRVA
jgi:hypothetical protein